MGAQCSQPAAATSGGRPCRQTRRPLPQSTRMTRPALDQVTLCAADTRAPALAAASLQRSMAGVDFARAVLFTHGWQPPAALAGIEVVQIPPLRSGADYSQFVMRELHAHVHTDHVLVTQWDGFVLDASAWRDEFLQYDYIGAVWPDQRAGRNVGNGGFSLRSRRFLAAGLDPRIVDTHPEDEVLCRQHRTLLEQDHGLRFAPPELARRFAFENEAARGPCFGFHGPYHLPRALDEATLSTWPDALPDAFFRGRDARRLARALIARRMGGVASALLARRQAAGLHDLKTRWLAVLAAIVSRWPARSGTGTD